MSSDRQELKDVSELQFLTTPQESGGEKFKRRMKENPFVPLGEPSWDGLNIDCI